MSDVPVFAVRCLTARHGNKEPFLTLDHLDVMYDKLIVYRNGNHCLHFALF